VVTARDIKRTLLFAVRSLQYLVPAPAVTRDVVGVAVDRLIRAGEASAGGMDTDRRNPRSGRAEQLASAMAAIGEENLAVASRAARDNLYSHLGAKIGSRQAVAASIGMELSHFARAPAARAAWSEVDSELWQAYPDDIVRLAHSDPILSLLLLLRRRITAEDVAAWHGPDWLFAAVRTHLGASWFGWTFPLAYFGLRILDDDGHEYLGDLATAGEVLGATPMPWIRGRWVIDRMALGMHVRLRTDDHQEPTYRSAETFGAFCVLAPYAQIRALPADAAGPGGAVLPLLNARREGSADGPAVQAAIDRLRWNDAQRALALRWVKGRVSAVGRAPAPA
jgi:hypothetical protein